MDLENFNAGNAKCYICGYNSGPENSIFYGSPFHEICLNSLGSDWKDKITEPANPVLLYDWVTEKFATMPLPDLSDDGVVVIDDSESQFLKYPCISNQEVIECLCRTNVFRESAYIVEIWLPLEMIYITELLGM